MTTVPAITSSVKADYGRPQHFLMMTKLWQMGVPASAIYDSFIDEFEVKNLPTAKFTRKLKQWQKYLDSEDTNFAKSPVYGPEIDREIAKEVVALATSGRPMHYRLMQSIAIKHMQLAGNDTYRRCFLESQKYFKVKCTYEYGWARRLCLRHNIPTLYASSTADGRIVANDIDAEFTGTLKLPPSVVEKCTALLNKYGKGSSTVVAPSAKAPPQAADTSGQVQTSSRSAGKVSHPVDHPLFELSQGLLFS